VLKGLADRFKECTPEKNCTLIRYDILVVLRRVFDLVNDEQIRLTAERLMTMEEDLKYRKKYATVWRKNKPVCSANIPRSHLESVAREPNRYKSA
jgi:hypothetical protein